MKPMERMRQTLSDAAAALGRLAPRERRMVALAGAAVAVFVLAVFTLSVTRSIDSRERRIRTKQQQIEEVARLTVGYRAQEAQRNELDRRLRGNSVRLFTYLDELSKKNGIAIGGMNDKGAQPLGEGTKINEQSVEVTFTRIPLEKLINFLSQVETGQGLVKVTRLQLRPRSDEPVLDAWLVVSTYTLES